MLPSNACGSPTSDVGVNPSIVINHSSSMTMPTTSQSCMASTGNLFDIFSGVAAQQYCATDEGFNSGFSSNSLLNSDVPAHDSYMKMRSHIRLPSSLPVIDSVGYVPLSESLKLPSGSPCLGPSAMNRSLEPSCYIQGSIPYSVMPYSSMSLRSYRASQQGGISSEAAFRAGIPLEAGSFRCKRDLSTVRPNQSSCLLQLQMEILADAIGMSESRLTFTSDHGQQSLTPSSPSTVTVFDSMSPFSGSTNAMLSSGDSSLPSVGGGSDKSTIDHQNSRHGNKLIRRSSYAFKKIQQRSVVCVPICKDGKQEGDGPPPDQWAWRKYGQKPIKGSPYPRGYYRCSSSKGCPARKQIERSRCDPNIFVVTYTSDHNHPWPVASSCCGVLSTGSSISHQSSMSMPPDLSSPSPSSSLSSPLSKGNDTLSATKEEATVISEFNQRESEREASARTESLFSSIINLENGVDKQQHVASPLNSVHVYVDEESLNVQRDVNLCLSRSNTELDDVFDDLGELPELSVIFSRESIGLTNQFDR